MNLVQQTPSDITLDGEKIDLIKQHRRRSSLKLGEAALSIAKDVPQPGASPPAYAPKGVRQPKWCLCFRMDKPPPKDRSASELAWKNQRDFFVTVIDPPSFMCNFVEPFFASEIACQIANLVVTRPCLEYLPGQSFERKAVAAVGPNCVTAGFVAAMLGAKVAFVTERLYLQNVQQNVKLYLKDTLDYTKMKSNIVAAVCAERSDNLSDRSLCDALNAPPPLDVIIISESGAAACKMSVVAHELDPISRLFRLLEELVPPQAATKVLLICDNYLSLDYVEDSSPPAQDERLPIEAELPMSWHLTPFITILHRFPVVWLQRMDADVSRRHKPLIPFRRYLPPMGAASARCGCGGHPQRNFLNHRVMNFDWQDNHQRLKETLVLHNRWKHTENSKELEKAKAWAASGCRMLPDATFMEGKSSAVSSDVSSSFDRVNGLAHGMMSSISGSEPDSPFLCDTSSARDCLQETVPSTIGDAVIVSGEGMSRQVRPPPLSASKSPRSRPGTRGLTGRLANEMAKTSTIIERHSQPPHWYRCNRVPY